MTDMAIDLYSYQACLGTLVIDWANRKYTFSGMDGTGTAEMTAEAVQAVIAEHVDKPDVEVAVLIFWPENEQLAVHDAAGFEGELDHDRESKGEDDEEET
jgi:hypothetical protein